MASDFPYWGGSTFKTGLSAVQRQIDHYFNKNNDNVYPLRGTGFRLAELLGIPLDDYAELEGSTVGFNMACSPLFLCAYQKIYFDYYRLSDREPNDPTYYNLDQFYNSASVQGVATKMFTLRYRPWKRDFFTNLCVSPLQSQGDVGSLGYGLGSSADDKSLVNSFQQWLAPTKLFTYNNAETPARSDATNVSAYSVTTNPSLIGALSPTSIRTSFAVQKLMEITRRAGKHYDAQTLAHFGVKVPTGIAGEVTYLGGQVSEIRIGDVIATAGTESDPLGKVGGKGFGYTDGKTIKFEAPCHGVLMAIYSAEPVADYSCVMFDKLNTLVKREHWFTEEYDELGMQPFFNYQQDFDTNPTSQGVNNSAIIGWQYRYSELKQKYNRVAGALMRSLKYWSPQRNLREESADWNVPVSRYLISPYYLDTIMLKNYEFDMGRWSTYPEPGDDDYTEESHAGFQEAFDSDPLIHELYFDVKKSSRMSVYGLEQL